jgi:hypothetical protein
MSSVDKEGGAIWSLAAGSPPERPAVAVAISTTTGKYRVIFPIPETFIALPPQLVCALGCL